MKPVKGIRLGRGEKARGQIIIGTPGTCMDWVVKFKSIDPSKIKVSFCKVLRKRTFDHESVEFFVYFFIP